MAIGKCTEAQTAWTNGGAKKRVKHLERSGMHFAAQSKEAGNESAFCARLLRLRHKTPPLRMLHISHS